MVIKRVGPNPEEPTHTQSLGRVRVTIDDLQALLELLSEHFCPVLRKGEEVAPKPPKVEFDGGYFTESEEMRKLSDDELRSLRLATPRVQVVLGPTQAETIGDEIATRDVYQLWARARQVNIPPPKGQRYIDHIDRNPSIAELASFMTVLICAMSAMVTGIGLLFAHAFHPGGVLFILLSVGACAVGAWHIARSRRRHYRRVNGAQIVPITLEELRRTETSDRYPRKQWVVAIWAAVTAMLGLIATILVAMLDKS